MRRMKEQPFQACDGLYFSPEFCNKVRALWKQVENENPLVVADLRRVGAGVGPGVCPEEWTIFIVPKVVVPKEHILLLDGIPISISPRDRRKARGKVFHFGNNSILLK